MSLWRCEHCGKERYGKDDTTIMICYGCQKDMREVEDEG